MTGSLPGHAAFAAGQPSLSRRPFRLVMSSAGVCRGPVTPEAASAAVSWAGRTDDRCLRDPAAAAAPTPRRPRRVRAPCMSRVHRARTAARAARAHASFTGVSFVTSQTY